MTTLNLNLPNIDEEVPPQERHNAETDVMVTVRLELLRNGNMRTFLTKGSPGASDKIALVLARGMLAQANATFRVSEHDGSAI